MVDPTLNNASSEQAGWVGKIIAYCANNMEQSFF